MFFDKISIFSSVIPWNESTALCRNIIVLETWQSLEALSSTPTGEIDMSGHRVFRRKFNFQLLLSETFFDVICYFGSVKA